MPSSESTAHRLDDESGSTAIDLALLLLADARLPSGGHALSAGLEPAVLAGLTADQVPGYLSARLRTVALLDAATTVLACRGTHPAKQVARAWSARTPSHVLREASLLSGRGLARVLASVEPTGTRAESARRWLGEAGPHPRPLVLGALAAALGLDPRRAAMLSAYDDVQTVAAAALKLLPLDPLTTVGWSLATRPAVTALVARATQVEDPDDLPALGAPQLELWHHAHATTTRRLFRA